MKPSESVALFEENVEAGGWSLLELTAHVGVKQMMAFYASRVAQCCVGPNEDMLLFEWGTYNWGEGESFELSLTRQFMEQVGEGQPEISQLRLVFKYPPNAELSALGEGSRWCASRSELAEFAKYVEESPAFQAVARQQPPRVRLLHHYV